MVTIIKEVLLSIDSKSGGLASFFQSREHVPPGVIILRAGRESRVSSFIFTARRIRTLRMKTLEARPLARCLQVRKQIYLSSF